MQKKQRSNEEAVLQQKCYMWFNEHYVKLRWSGINHVPNGGKRTKADARMFKAIGVIPGWPDLQVFPGDGKCFFIEMKKPGECLDPDQVKVHADLTERGYKVFVCDNIEDFKQIIISCMVP